MFLKTQYQCQRRRDTPALAVSDRCSPLELLAMISVPTRPLSGGPCVRRLRRQGPARHDAVRQSRHIVPARKRLRSSVSKCVFRKPAGPCNVRSHSARPGGTLSLERGPVRTPLSLTAGVLNNHIVETIARVLNVLLRRGPRPCRRPAAFRRRCRGPRRSGPAYTRPCPAGTRCV